MRFHPVPWIVRPFPSTLRRSTGSQVHRRGKKRDVLRCTLSAHGKDGHRRHTSQLECDGPQLHPSTKRPPIRAGVASTGLFRGACPAATRTGTIHSRSFGKARGQLLAPTERWRTEAGPPLRCSTPLRFLTSGSLLSVAVTICGPCPDRLSWPCVGGTASVDAVERVPGT